MYEISFYAFMDCKSAADCRKAKDYIRAYVYQGPFENDMVEVKYSDFEGMSQWKKFSVRIGSVFSDLNVSSCFSAPKFFQCQMINHLII